MCTFVGVPHHYIGIWAHFELCLGLFSNVIWAAAFTYYIYLDASWCSICACLSSFWAWFWGFPTGMSYPMHKKTCINICVPLLVFFITTSVFELTLSSVLTMWFELLPLHTTYTSMHLDVLYMCLFELILSLILSFPHWNLSYPMPKHDINIRVAWLKLFITTSIFELILSSVLSFFQCDLSCCLYILHIPWCPVRVGLSSFWAWFWAFPIGIWAIPCQNMTSTYVYLCWCSSSLHRYLSSLWALSWAFSNVIWAAAFTYYIYLDASWCPICVCLSSFWAWFWVFPTGIWAIPCTKKHT